MPNERTARPAPGAAAEPTTNGVGHPAPSRHRVSPLALWFGLVGAPAAWSAQLLIDYPFAAHACYPHLVPLTAPFMGRGRLWTILAIVSIAAVLVSLAALAVAYRSWRATKDEAAGETHEALDSGEGRTRFMAMAAVMTGTLFSLAAITHGISLLLVSPCQ
jgi:uncharacterized membrane protein